MPEKRKQSDAAVVAGVMVLLLVLSVLFAVAVLAPLFGPGHR
jgi:sorbitol-specific phosphotransferase system component IIBC